MGDEHLQRLGALPRPTGSEAVAEARAYCSGVFAELGFTVTERPFEYSSFPGRMATPVGGAWTVATVTLAAGAALRNHDTASIAILAFGLLALSVFGVWMARAGVLASPWLRARGTNLEATRGTARPAVWLVAHLDSKWQPVPMLARIAGILALGGAALLAAALALTQWLQGAGPHAWWPAVIAVTWIGGLPVMASIVGDHSAGALDNASGVAAVLQAARLLERNASVGVLITDAEELGAAGARAWVKGRPPAVALNCDGIDDAGPFTVMYTGRQPIRLTLSLWRGPRAGGARARIVRLLPGMLTDSVAFADAGWSTATLSRGSLRTLLRVHSTADSLDRLRGTGIALAARVLATTAQEVR